MGTRVPRAPEWRSVPERAQQLARLQELAREPRQRRTAMFIYPMAAMLFGLGALMFVLALVIVSAPDAAVSRVLTDICAGWEG